jgi:hypothetical protein
MSTELLGINSADFDVIGRLLIRYSTLVRYTEKKKKRESNGAVYQPVTDFGKACSV